MDFWLGFHVLLFAALALDLGLNPVKSTAISTRTSALWSVFWIVLSILFGVYIWQVFGAKSGMDYATVYVMEKLLSLDNLFIFLLIFKTLKIERRFQHRILFWGILGAIFFRGLAIVAGIELLAQFWWTAYVFGALLIFSGVKLLGTADKPEDDSLAGGALLQALKGKFKNIQDGRFIIWEDKKFSLTILMLALCAIEVADIVFALDSVPAALAITSDFRVVYTANVMAILGLRALYSLLAALITAIPMLHQGLAVTLVFIGAKMGLAPHYHIETYQLLLVILIILGISIAWGRLRSRRVS